MIASIAQEDELERYHYAQACTYLSHVRGLGVRIRSLKDETDAQRELVDGLHSLDYTNDGAHVSSPDAIPNAVIRLQDLIESYCVELAKYVDEQHRAHRCFSLLSRPEYVQALTARYLLCQPWERVCIDMGYTWDGMMSLRKAAVLELFGIMPCEWRDQIPRAI